MTFNAKVTKINDWSIIRLPDEISQLLSSRGMAMAIVKVNENSFTVPLEPDGYGSHWFRVLSDMHVSDDHITISLKPTEKWIEPSIPSDLKDTLTRHHLIETWASLTVKARWEWIRWIRFTKNSDTRLSRLETTCSMLKEGKKRPCCFDHSRCTETHVSKSGKLIDS